MNNNNLEGWLTFKNKDIVLVSFDKQGQMVTKEMSALGYFFSRLGKIQNTKCFSRRFQYFY
jgi:hypothetical protein